ncbi:GNAT family N-acetyltransferase [Microbacterium sp.]|uniref:GNAT family N-acetyltransferase n=1 Tax=Microbacterium sp. TaxID=51671 RepID=UPI0028111F33|nr:GNAT family N-acetyltransferase [Microbacterium sp.]
MIDARALPTDPRSTARLADAGFDYRTVDMTDPAQAVPFSRAVTRGFLGDEPTDAALSETVLSMSARRCIGVFRQGAASDELPVGTIDGWVTPLTIPGGEIPMWAISGVTVAATHRRRGIARNMLEGELRTAAAAGVPVAGLTVSEATIYSRYGFGHAVPMANVRVDTRRAGWVAPDSPGTVEYIEREQLARDLEQVHERSRRVRSGQIPGWAGRWRRMAGLSEADTKAAAVRGVRYIDAQGEVRGALAYTLEEHKDEFRAAMHIRHLGAETDEALRALWGFVVHHDLVTSADVDLRPVDDPLPWLVADHRAVTVTVHDHGWLRILDVPAALSARSYRHPLDIVIRVDDALGFADGTWRLTVDENGSASVAATEDAPHLRMGVVELSSLYAGGVRATQLAAAGRILGDAAVLASVDDALRTAQAAALGIWY